MPVPIANMSSRMLSILELIANELRIEDEDKDFIRDEISTYSVTDYVLLLTYSQPHDINIYSHENLAVLIGDIVPSIICKTLRDNGVKGPAFLEAIGAAMEWNEALRSTIFENTEVDVDYEERMNCWRNTITPAMSTLYGLGREIERPPF